VLLTRALRVTGLAWGCRRCWPDGGRRRAVHDPRKIIADLTVMLALGADCLADIAMLRGERGRFGPVASDPWYPGWCPAWPRMRQTLKAIRAARAAAASESGRWPANQLRARTAG
jgi:hypothetical protein